MGRLADHPIVAWLLENLSVLGISWLRALLQLPRRQSFRRIFVTTLAGGFIVIEGSMAVQRVLIEHVYAHVPHFSEASRKRSQRPMREFLGEWLRCNLLSHMLASATMSLILTAKPAPLYRASLIPRRLHLGPFLRKLAVARLASDVAFYVVHRALHMKLLYWLHKRHHEHASTALVTNFHFSVPDLLLEGFVPLVVGLGALEGLGFKVSQFEGILIATYIQWYELGSHSGKPMPTVTIFPPLAPLYRLFLGPVDARNVEFHDQHHACRRCNYGITQWLDCLLGTAKMPPEPPPSNQARVPSRCV